MDARATDLRRLRLDLVVKEERRIDVLIVLVLCDSKMKQSMHLGEWLSERRLYNIIYPKIFQSSSLLRT